MKYIGVRTRVVLDLLITLSILESTRLGSTEI